MAVALVCLVGLSRAEDSTQEESLPLESMPHPLLLESSVPFYHDYNLAFFHLLGSKKTKAAPSQSQALTLSECIDQALGGSQDYKIAQENLRAAFGDMALAWGLFTPAMFTTYGINQNRQTNTLNFPGQSLRSTRMSDASSSTMGLSYNVFNQAQMYFGMRNAYFLRRERRSDLRGMELQVADNVRAAYFDVLRQQHLTHASDEQVGQLKEQLRQTEARLKVGEVTKLDVLQARIDLQNEQLLYLQYKNLLAAARENLNLAVGGGLDSAFTLVDEFRVEEPVLEVESLVEEAIQHNPTLLSLELQYRQQRNNLWMGRLAYLPTVKATVGYSRSADGFLMHPRDQSGATLGMLINWSILDGFARFRENRYTQADANNLRFQIEKTRLEVARDVRLGCLELERLYEQNLTLAESRDLAAQSLELERRSYTLGSANMVEVRKAQADYIQAEVNYINSIYDYHTALSALGRNVGRDLSNYGN
ncbi:TolC family protein [bacterium]|nr:TolC family protein [bacterium]